MEQLSMSPRHVTRRKPGKPEPGVIYEVGGTLHGFGAGCLMAFDAKREFTIRPYEDEESYMEAYGQLEDWLIGHGFPLKKGESRPALFLL